MSAERKHAEDVGMLFKPNKYGKEVQERNRRIMIQ